MTFQSKTFFYFTLSFSHWSSRSMNRGDWRQSQTSSPRCALGLAHSAVLSWSCGLVGGSWSCNTHIVLSLILMVALSVSWKLATCPVVLPQWV